MSRPIVQLCYMQQYIDGSYHARTRDCAQVKDERAQVARRLRRDTRARPVTVLPAPAPLSHIAPVYVAAPVDALKVVAVLRLVRPPAHAPRSPKAKDEIGQEGEEGRLLARDRRGISGAGESDVCVAVVPFLAILLAAIMACIWVLD